jgi:RNA 2',3'-cyclic 3'-phosphodiesterase
LFFALWPAEVDRAGLSAAVEAAVRHCGGRPVPAASLHVTLAFLGAVDARRLPELRQIAARQACAYVGSTPVRLRFDALAHWARPQILCAIANEAAAALVALAAALKAATAAAGFTPDLKPFRPHVTVARKVRHCGKLPPLAPSEWSCREFALIVSRTDPRGPVYSVVESWSLVKAAKADE